MNTSSPWRACMAAAITLALAGCRAGYDVDVRNLTDQPITAKLTVPHSDGTPTVLQEKYVGIGDRTNLVVQRGANEPVALVVDFQGNIGYPATLDLSRGATIVNVRRAEEGARGRLQLQEVPRP